MGDKTRILMAIKNAARFQSWGLARSLAARQVHPVAVLPGDDGRFWAPATMADMERLLRAWYEAAEHWTSLPALPQSPSCPAEIAARSNSGSKTEHRAWWATLSLKSAAEVVLGLGSEMEKVDSAAKSRLDAGNALYAHDRET